jgi:hypothetical protein
MSQTSETFCHTSFCASTALSKYVSTPDLKSSTFSLSKRSSSLRISRPMSSKSSLAWCTRRSASATSALSWFRRSCCDRPCLRSLSWVALRFCSSCSAVCHEWYDFWRCWNAVLTDPINRMYSSMTMPIVRTSCCACRSYNSRMRICISDRLSNGVDREDDSSTAESECSEAEKSPQASASPFRCMTTVSVALSRALS